MRFERDRRTAIVTVPREIATQTRWHGACADSDTERVFEKSRFCHISPTMFSHSSFQTAGANPGPRTVSLDLPGLFKRPLRKMIPKRSPKLTYPKIFARNADAEKIRPILAIARIIRQPRPWASAVSVGKCQLRSTQTRKTVKPSIWPRNRNLANTGRVARSTRSWAKKYMMRIAFESVFKKSYAWTCYRRRDDH